MIHLANILIAASDRGLAQDLLTKIRRYGYDGRTVESQAEALAAVERERPDLVLAAETLSEGSVLALAKTLAEVPGCGKIPLALVAATRSAELKLRALAVDDVLSLPLDEAKLQARLRPLVRLAIMRTELRQRAATARRFGIVVNEELPRADTETDYPLLVVGPSGAAATAPLDGARLYHAADPFAADEVLARENFDAALLLPSDDPAPYLDLCAQIRNNPRLFNLPVIIVSRPGLIDEAAAYHHGASNFFAEPIDAAEIKAAVLTLVRRQRLRWMIRSALAQTLQPPSRDAATGVYTRRFFDAYLDDRFAFAVAHRRQLSLMFFRVPDIEGIRQRFGERQSDHLRLQVAQWISGLLRGEDLTARYEQNEFCVVLPDTPKIEAEVVMNRIAGVLAYTDFAVKDVYEPVKVWVRAGAAELAADDDRLDRLIARARQNIV